MLTQKVEPTEKNLVISPSSIEMVIEDDGVGPFSIFLPPLEEILEIRSLSGSNFSLKDHVEKKGKFIENDFRYEIEKLEEKRDRFHDSQVYFNRLSNLAELANLSEKSLSYLNEAKEIKNNSFINHRIGDTLVTLGRVTESEKIFSSLDLKSDIYANLRMAYFSIKRFELEKSTVYVKNALEINPVNYSARLLDGALSIVLGHYELAVRSLRIASFERPTSAIAKTNMAIAYLYLNNHEKALTELKKAVALDPLNQNAITLLSDLSNVLDCDEEAVPSLRFFLQFEQKIPTLWSRLARALLKIGNIEESVAALKRQGSIEDTSEVWNNLGVAYTKQKSLKKAYECFAHSMRLGQDNPNQYFLAGRNLAFLLSENKMFHELIRFSETLLTEDTNEVTIKDDVLSDIWAIYLFTLASERKLEKFLDVARDVLRKNDTAPRLQAWIVNGLLAHFSLTSGAEGITASLIQKYKGLADDLSPKDTSRRDMLLNNIAFFYAEHGDITKSEMYLRRISYLLHKEPYPTATLGLINMRKGNTDKAIRLYEEAIHLSTNKLDKVKIRQKLNFELAKYYLPNNPSKAHRYFSKVTSQPGGSPELVILAKQAQASLPHH